MIRTILIPIGMQSPLEPHLHYAIKLTKQFQAKLTLLQTYPIHHGVHATTGGFAGTAASSPVVEPFEEKKIRENTEKQLSKIPEIKEIAYELLILPGPSAQVIAEQTGELDPDLLVLNSDEANGLEAFFGSEAEMLSRKAYCSTLIVPDGTMYEHYEKIVLALDEGQEKEKTSFDDLLAFITKYDASLEAIHVTDSEPVEVTRAQDEIYHSLKERMIKEKITSFTFQTIVESDITEGLNAFIASHHVDLLVLLYRDHGFFKRLFNPGVRKQMIREANIPLLILK